MRMIRQTCRLGVFVAAGVGLIFGAACTSSTTATVNITVASVTPTSSPPAAAAPTTPVATTTPATRVDNTPLGRLNWGTGADGSSYTAAKLRTVAAAPGTSELRRQTRRIIEVAEQSLKNDVAVVVTIDREGRLSSDPRYRASDAALKSIDDIYLWAMCSRVAEAPLAAQCMQRASDGLDAWSRTYQSTGNPINDTFLTPLIHAVDLACPTVASERCVRWQAWVIDLARRGDHFYAGVKPTDGRYANNWMSHRLLLRGMSGIVGNDDALVASTQQLVAAHVARNLRTDGSSIDFHERDALHYHVYDIQPLLELALYAPRAIDAGTKQSIETGVQFLRPFVLGERVHVEFTNSTVPFDIQRKQSGDPTYSNSPWNPQEARILLRLARTIFPTVRTWTDSVVDDNYAPKTKQLAALFDSAAAQ